MENKTRYFTNGQIQENETHSRNIGVTSTKCSQQELSLLQIIKVFFTLGFSLIITLFSSCLNTFKKPKSLKGKICLVTGAGRGLGRELSKKLANLGAEVVCVDIREETNNETVKLIKDNGGKAHGYACNVAKYQEVMDLAVQVQKEVGRVYLLINNAALIMSHKAGEWPPEEVISMYNVNVISHHWTIQAFVPKMKEVNEGHIVSILSASSICATPQVSIYSATKAAADVLLDALRLELNYDENNKIIVTTVYPSLIITNEQVKDIYANGKLKPLKANYVAEKILEGIMWNKSFIAIPKIIYFCMILFKYLPIQLKLKFYKEMNIHMNVPSQKHKATIPFGDISMKCIDVGPIIR